MYVPREFAITGAPALAAFMRAHPFGVLLSAADGTPAATHLPLVVLRDGLDVVLGTHMARANPHWRELDGADVLAIFQGPHGYVSPRWYTDPQRSVPTWNYAAVHCRGRARLADAQLTASILDETVRRMEGPNGWSIAQADAAYIGALRDAIVGVEITVNAITGKEKFSQNRCAEDREQVAAALATSARPSDWELARAMRAAADGRPDG